MIALRSSCRSGLQHILISPHQLHKACIGYSPWVRETQFPAVHNDRATVTWITVSTPGFCAKCLLWTLCAWDVDIGKFHIGSSRSNPSFTSVLHF